MSAPPLGREFTLGVERYDFTAPIFDRLVPAEGIRAFEAPGGYWHTNGLLNGTLDIADVPFTRFLFAKDQGDPITAIPVFTDRRFMHQYAYAGLSSDLQGYADLRGRRVEVTGSYWTVQGVWHRGILEDEYGITPQEIDWYHVLRDPDPRMEVPEGISRTVVGGGRHGYPGGALVVEGMCHALLTGAVPTLPEIRRGLRHLIPDAYKVQREWHQRTGLHPIEHLIVVRDEALAAWPELGVHLCHIFEAAKAHLYRARQVERLSSLPFMREYLDDTTAVFGDDPWPYGLQRNRAVVDKFLEYSHRQRLTTRRWAIEEIFDGPAAEYGFGALVR